MVSDSAFGAQPGASTARVPWWGSPAPSLEQTPGHHFLSEGTCSPLVSRMLSSGAPCGQGLHVGPAWGLRTAHRCLGITGAHSGRATQTSQMGRNEGTFIPWLRLPSPAAHTHPLRRTISGQAEGRAASGPSPQPTEEPQALSHLGLAVSGAGSYPHTVNIKVSIFRCNSLIFENLPRGI